MSFPTTPEDKRAEIATIYRKVVDKIERGDVSAFLLVCIDTRGFPRSCSGAMYNSTVALMLRELVQRQFSCDCDDPKCKTALTQASLLAILESYITDIPISLNS